MIKKLKWNYEICINYLNMLFTDVELPLYLTTTTKYVDLLCEKLNKINEQEKYKPEDFLSHIFRFCTNNKELNLIVINIPQGKYESFFQSKEKLITLNKSKLKENLVKACLLQQKEFQITFENIQYNDNLSLKSNIDELMNNKKISELEAYSIFYNQNDIIFNNDNAIRNVTKENIQELDSNNSRLNYLREEIAEVLIIKIMNIIYFY